MIVWTSRTGNVKSIINKIPSIETLEMTKGLIVNKPFVFFTYTDGLGEAPAEALDFLQKNNSYLKGVIASGNTNFKHFGGHVYAGAADVISNKFNVPILHKVDLRGYDSDIQKIIKQYQNTMEDIQ